MWWCLCSWKKGGGGSENSDVGVVGRRGGGIVYGDINVMRVGRERVMMSVWPDERGEYMLTSV